MTAGRRGWNINLLANAQTAATARAAYSAQRQDRINNFINIHGPHLPIPEAARRLGVSERTIQRYRAALRAAS